MTKKNTTAVATKTYTAQATASNFHNWLLDFTITQEDLDSEYDGDIDLWLEAIHSGDIDIDDADQVIDEGDGGAIEVDAYPYEI